MAKVTQGLSQYEFWRWEYQRRNQGYRDAIEQLVALVNARTKADCDVTQLLEHLESEAYEKDLVQLLTSPFISREWVISSPLFPLVAPREFVEFIKNHKRIPEHYSRGFSGQELLEHNEINAIAGQFDQSLFHIPGFCLDFTLPDGFKTHIDIRMPFDADIELLQLELAYIHAVCTAMMRHPDELPDDEEADLDEIPDVLDGPASTSSDPMGKALDALRSRWRAKRSNERARFSALPRAVGLWLYDYTELERATPTKAANAFSEIFQDGTGTCRIGRQFDDAHLLMKLLSTTRKCVETIEVLPIRMSHTPKVVP
jgi:hypothetical protein